MTAEYKTKVALINLSEVSVIHMKAHDNGCGFHLNPEGKRCCTLTSFSNYYMLIAYWQVSLTTVVTGQVSMYVYLRDLGVLFWFSAMA